MRAFTFIYYAGIASCGMQGAKKAAWSLNLSAIFIISPLLTSFGGGLVRDTSLIHVFPVVFTAECRFDILVALMAAFLYMSYQKKSYMPEAAEWFIIVADACGLGTFISIGVDKSIAMGANPAITLLCGIATSLGGGILSSVFCGVPLWEVLSSNIAYRLTAVLGSVIYMFWRYTGTESSVAQYAIVFYTSVSVLACNQMVRQRVKKYIKSIPHSKSICHTLLAPYQAGTIQTPYMQVIYYTHDAYKTTYITHIRIRQRAILFHRILQM